MAKEESLHRTSARPPVCSHHRHTNIKNPINGYGNPNATEKNRMAARTFREKKKQQQQQSRVFFDIIFDVYTHVDDRGRAKASENKGDEFRWKKNIKISWRR